MTALTDFTAQIAGWLNREDYLDDQPLLISFVRMAEERMNEELRIADMIQIDYALITKQRVKLPADWIASDFLLDENRIPLRYLPRDEFYAQGVDEAIGTYTITGNYIAFGGPVDLVEGNTVEMAYYGMIPKLGDDPTWLITKYPSLYLHAALSAASAYGIEDERAIGWEASVSSKIARLNQSHLVSKASGSRISRGLRKGFG